MDFAVEFFNESLRSANNKKCCSFALWGLQTCPVPELAPAQSRRNFLMNFKIYFECPSYWNFFLHRNFQNPNEGLDLTKSHAVLVQLGWKRTGFRQICGLLRAKLKHAFWLGDLKASLKNSITITRLGNSKDDCKFLNKKLKFIFTLRLRKFYNNLLRTENLPK